METRTMSPKAPRLTVEEENVLVSQVLEIIGGITLEALQTLDQPEEREVWSMEEGDDSVFYSDEDQTHQDATASTSRDFGANASEHLVRREAAGVPQREGDPGAQASGDKGNSDMEKEAAPQLVLAEGEEERQELRTPKTVCQSGSADPGAEDSLTPENLVSIGEESPQPICTNADVQTQSEQNASSEKATPQVKEEEVVLEAQTPNLESFDVTNEESCTRPNREAEVPKEMSGAELQIQGAAQLEVDWEPEQDRNFLAPAGFHQGPRPGCSTLPLPKKSGQQKPFDHLTASKYSTVSYRRIRRGNTRQKIEEFEHMMMNL